METTEGYMRDAQGRLVPEAMVSAVDKLRDQTVRAIMARTFAEREGLVEFKRRAWEEIWAFLTLSAEQHGVAYRGKRGNITLTTYDGRYKLCVAVNDTIQFNEKLLVEDAFYVDKQGHINKNRILGLRRLAIEDGEWQEAMKAITESIQIASTKTYIRFYERVKDGSYVQIPLDVVAL
jgi:hypothetical protein